MKISIIRTDSKNVMHLSVKTAAWFFERIKTDTKAADVGRLRDFIARVGSDDNMPPSIPDIQVCPLVEMKKTDNGLLEVAACNGIVWLHVPGLMTAEEVDAVKEASKMLPTTFATFTGADGRSVELLVAVAWKNDPPLPRQEPDIDRFLQAAYDVAFKIYSGILPKPIERRAAKARSGFRMTLDAAPYYHPQATPLTVQPLTTASTDDTAQDEGEIRESDMSLYAVYEQMYRRAVAQARQATSNRPEAERYHAYITALSQNLCDMGIPEEEAFLHLRNHHVCKSGYREDEFRAIHEAVYAESRLEKQKEQEEQTADGMVSVETQRLISFLRSRYVFRLNTVMGYAEYRPNNTWIQDWSPCDETAINGMTLEARLANLDVRDKDVRRYVHSNKIRQSDPISDFIVKVADKWDGKTDHIAMLARCVPCDIPQWERWFKKWFVSMVAQWVKPQRDYGNAIVPLLISSQGDGKTTFCRMILPRELRWGFLENLEVSEKRATLQAMHNFLLINLDEFNQISPKLQQGFLKNVIQLPSVKIKRPYGHHVEEFRRYASFIATTNETNVLSDPTGSRRFICVRLTAPVNTDYKPNYEALYGQAYQLLMDNADDWWFHADEVAQIMEHNRQFQVTPTAMLYFNEHYEAATDENDGKWLSATTIYEELRKTAGAGLKANGVHVLGRYLRNMAGLQQRRIGTNRQYLVKKKP